MMSLWCSKFTLSIPPKVISWFERGISLKTSTSLVRAAYIGVLSVCCQSATASQTTQYIPLLVKCVEKAAAQPTQVIFVFV